MMLLSFFFCFCFSVTREFIDLDAQCAEGDLKIETGMVIKTKKKHRWRQESYKMKEEPHIVQ